MSDLTSTQAGQQQAIDLDKYVSKEDHEKVVSASKASEEKLKGELEQAKLSLLDPEYISYLESKRAKLEKKESAQLPEGKVNLSSLTPEQLVNYATQKAIETIEEKSGTRFRSVETQLQNVLAYIELKAVEERYDDFGDYREEAAKLLEDPRSNLTIEQAYLIAKQRSGKSSEPSEEKPKTLKKPSSEKPSGSSPQESFAPKSFKNKAEAADAAWESVVGTGKDTI